MAEEIVGSKLPQFASDAFEAPEDNKKTGYGQNGYMGASSDTELDNPTRSAMAVELFPAGDSLKGLLGNDKAATEAPQTRAVKSDLQPLSFGMAQRSPRK